MKQLCTLLVVIAFSQITLGQTQIGQDIDGEVVDDQSGVRVSLSADGSTVAIGAYLNDGNGSDAGHVRIYEYSGGSWIQLGSDIDGEAAGDQSGLSVSLSADGSTVAIGAYRNDGNGFEAGHVRIYEYSGGSWIQLGSDIDGEAAGDQSGFSVSLSADGNTVAIGARNNDGNGSDAGHVRIYEYSGGSWTQLGSDIDGEAAGDLSGWSISLSADGSRVAIGAYLNDGNGSDAGHVRIYEYSGGSWTQLGSDIDGEAADDYSGVSVSISADGSKVAIGAYGNDGNGSDAGHVRIYEYSGGSWIKLGSDIDGEAADDYSGYSVSLSADGDTVAIGAYLNDGNGTDAGHVRIYSPCGSIYTNQVVACNSYTWIDGVTYLASTTSPQLIFTAANGCDSIVSLDLTIESSVSSTDQVVACNSYTWIDGVTYSASTTSPQVTLTAANGCDSIVTLNLTLTGNVTFNEYISVNCSSYTWRDGITYTANTSIPTFTTSNSQGCDTTYTLNLILHNSSLNPLVSTPIGQGPNVYGTLDEPDALSVNPRLNAVAFIHRSNYLSNGDAGTGSLRYDLSLDGGASWNNEIGPIYNGDSARYPTARLTLPNNASPVSSNAKLVFTAPILGNSNNIWGGEVWGAVTPSQSSFYFFQTNTSNSSKKYSYRGAIWSAGNKLHKVQFQVDYAQGGGYTDTLIYSTYVLGSGISEVKIPAPMVHVLEPTLSIAFAPDGVVGYIAFSGDLGNIGDTTLYPIILKTADGGNTWSSPQAVNLQNIIDQNVLFGTGVNAILTTGFEADLTVDALGNFHYFTNVGARGSITGLVYSIFEPPYQGLYRIKGDGTQFQADLVAQNMTMRGDFTAGPYQNGEDNRPQLAINSNGTRILAAFYDSDTIPGNGQNQPNTAPNLFLRGYDVLNDIWYPLRKILPNNTSGDNQFFGVVGDRTFQCQDVEYASTVYTTQLAGDWIDSVQYNYLSAPYSFSNCSVTSTEIVQTCTPYTWIDGVTYAASTNTPEVRLTSKDGCDSLITLDLTINNAVVPGTDQVIACGSYTWIDGNTYTSSTSSPQVTLTAANGCDSIVSLDLTINNAVSGNDQITACGSYTWINGVTYTSSNNTATQTLTAANGCDSIVTLDLTINNSVSGTDQITACDSYTWIDGVTYSASTTSPQVTLTAANGCDSIVSLDLTIDSSVSSTDQVVACNSYTWIDGVTYSASTTSPQVTLTAANGCDSIVTLDLTINAATAGQLSLMGCDKVSLNGQSYTVSGNYIQNLTNSQGCDSVLTINVSVTYSNFIQTQPTDTSVGEGQNALFFLLGPPSAQYQWQTNLGLGYQDLSDFGQYSGTTTPNLQVSGVNITTNNNQAFRCLVTEGNCTDTSYVAVLEVLPNTSVNELEKIIELYPNPTSGNIKVILPEAQGVIRVYDVRGKMLEKILVNQKEMQVSLGSYANGVYLIQIEQNGMKTARRVTLSK